MGIVLGVLICGLSPHGRGKLLPAVRGVGHFGSIPARAGETQRSDSMQCLFRVYPRTGGGNCIGLGAEQPDLGLSPHGRGKRRTPVYASIQRRSIPARAGETRSAGLRWSAGVVYPRTGGGNGNGDLPGVRWRGLSPHGRGKPTAVKDNLIKGGSIPARAGETKCRCSPKCISRVYPRPCGGNWVFYGRAMTAGGLSPHGRGKRRRPHQVAPAPRSIPARAGETGRGGRPGRRRPVYPRTGGGNPRRPCWGRLTGGLSPHGRGKRVSIFRELLLQGSIPARAGETYSKTGLG